MKRAICLLALFALLLTGCTPEVSPVDGGGDPTNAEPNQPQPPAGPDLSDPYVVLVSATHPLPADQQPALKPVQGNFQMEVRAADAFLELKTAAKEAGHNLVVVSAYRPQATQARLYNNKVREFTDRGMSQAEAEKKAATIVARPGTSEHNTGLAVDVVSPQYQSLNSGFASTPTAKWLADNAHQFGFILRYAEDKQDITGIIFEPWHYRYVGVEHATYMKEHNLCLEEYWALGR